MDLTVKDLKQVRALLFKARDKWYNIGIELEIDVEMLNIINNKFEDPGDKLVHMLQVWLKQFDPHPTWKALARALMADAVNEVPIAEEASALDDHRSAQIQAGLVLLPIMSPGKISGNKPQLERDQVTGSYSPGVRSRSVPKMVPTRQLLAISSHSSYHGVMSSEEAESMLKMKNSDCYLTRYSETREKFTLSVCTRKGIFQNFEIIIEGKHKGESTYEISGTEEKFPGIAALLAFYKKNPLNPHIDEIGEELVSERRMSTQDEKASVDHKDSSPKKKEKVALAVPSWKIREILAHTSFHGHLDMDEAETKLRRAGKDCCYLTRYSESIDEHILSVLRRKNDDDIVFQHFRITIWHDEKPAVSYEILGSTEKFESIDKLLKFYKTNPLNHYINNIGDEVERDTEVCIQDTVYVKYAENYREDLDCAVPQWALTGMDSHPSFHGSITRQEAVKKLIDAGRSCYLTRYSDYNKFCVISMLNLSYSCEFMLHLELKIPLDSSQKVYKVGGMNKEFDSISKLLEYYQKHPLNQTKCLGEYIHYQNGAAADSEDSNDSEVLKGEMSHPTRANLSRISYKDDEGKRHDFKLLELVIDKWQRAATLLAFSKDRSGNDAECCKHIFSKWIKKGGRKEYPLTWVGLHRLLFDMGKRSVAEKLYKVLKYRKINVIDQIVSLHEKHPIRTEISCIGSPLSPPLTHTQPSELLPHESPSATLFHDGIKFCGNPFQYSVTPQGAVIEPPHTGLSLSIPNKTLSSTEKSVDLLIHPCFSGPFELPSGYEPASPAYLIELSRKVDILRDVTVRVHHYACLQSEEDCEEIAFLSASPIPQYREYGPVYIFKEIKKSKGVFSMKSQVGEIALRHFCLMKLGRKSSRDTLHNCYSARLYRAPGPPTAVSAVFCMCIYHPLYMKHCDDIIMEEYSALSCKGIAKSDCLVQMKAEEVMLTVQKSEGWDITFDRQLTIIRKKEVDIPNFLKNADISTCADYPPKFSIFAQPTCDGTNSNSPQLVVQGLDGVDRFEIIVPGSGEDVKQKTPKISDSSRHYQSPGTEGHDAPSLVKFISFPMAESRVNLAEKIGVKFYDFGILLLNDDSGDLISSIERKQSQNASGINVEVFKMWLQGRGKQPVTWDTLVAVLRDIGLNKLADDINHAKRNYRSSNSDTDK